MELLILAPDREEVIPVNGRQVRVRNLLNWLLEAQA